MKQNFSKSQMPSPKIHPYKRLRLWLYKDEVADIIEIAKNLKPEYQYLYQELQEVDTHKATQIFKTFMEINCWNRVRWRNLNSLVDVFCEWSLENMV